MTQLKPVEKVASYITRKRGDRLEVLVFEHRDIPEAGIQVPAGTVDRGESIEAALLREVKEESGLTFEHPGRSLGRFEWIRKDRNELHFRNVFQIESTGAEPEAWFHTVGGHGEDDGMVFRYFWLSVLEAKNSLAADQGLYLAHLK